MLGGHAGTRARQARLLVWPAARTVRWIPLLASGPLGFFIVYSGLHAKGGSVSPHLPLAAIALCLSAAFVLDDASAETVGGTPTPLLLRHGIRVTVQLPALLALWGAILAYAGSGQMAGAMSVEFFGMLALAFALAAVGSRLVGGERAGMFASPAFLIVLSASQFVPARWRPFPLDPISPRLFDLYGRWSIALLVSIAVFAIASRDPTGANPMRRMLLAAVRRRELSHPAAPEAVR